MPAAEPGVRPAGSIPRLAGGDVVAGISVALVLIPQSLAYASLAGVPAHLGLYASILPPIAAALFASSPYLQTGPTAMTSLLTLGSLSVIAPIGSDEYVALAVLLAFVVGIARLAIGLVRAGVVAHFLSQPVMLGFTTGAGLLIVGSQLPTALGVNAPVDDVLGSALWSVGHPAVWQPAALALSVLTILLVLGGRRLHPLFPGVLVAVLVGIAYSRVAGYQGPMIGEVPRGLPHLPGALPWSRLAGLLVPGGVIALVGFAEPASIARTLAAQDRRPWDPNREFVSQGVANLVAGLSGGFPVGASFSRSFANQLAGARTRWSGAITGLVVLLFLPLAGILQSLPRAVLSAIVITSVLKLVQLGPLARLYRYTRFQAYVAWATFGLTLALAPRVDYAVVAGVGMAVGLHLWRELRVQVRTRFSDGTLHLEPIGVLFFASAPDLDETLIRELALHPDADRLILDLEQLGRVDYTGAVALKTVAEHAATAGLTVEFVGIPPQARSLLTRVLGSMLRGE